jgi:hypothetical protein
LRCLVLAGSLQFLPASAQLPYTADRFTINAGVNVMAGTHYNRIGFNIGIHYVYGHFQSNTEARVYYNFLAPGPAKKYFEATVSQGLVGAFGTADHFSRFYSTVSNQTGYAHSIGYAYNLYLNRAGTTQQTGVISIQSGSFAIITENDILGRPSLDRFRTAAFLLQYTGGDVQAGISCALWTGQMGYRKEIDDPHFKAGCYMDTAGGKLTHVSHGFLSTFGTVRASYGQTARLNAGIDAERVRNALQNRIMHDMLLGKNTLHRKKNCHIPMVDTSGAPFLYREGQQLRKSRPFVNISANPSLFY